MGPLPSVLHTVGRTPMVRLARVNVGGARIFAKCEQLNPGGSVKDRIAKAMVENAEGTGLLRPGMTVVEPTSGNTGIGLALVCAAKGYRLILTMPDTMSLERRALLKTYGAEVVLTPGEEDMAGAVRKASGLAQERPGHVQLRQFENPANPAAHEATTGPEILSALAAEGVERVDALVAGVGTGGTITGVGRTVRQRFPSVRIVAVEPERSPVLSGGRPGPHRIQGIGAGFVPAVLDRGLLHDVLRVSDEDAHAMTRRLCLEEGLLVGISSGANVAAALRIAHALPAAAVVVTFLCDAGDRYFSMEGRPQQPRSPA